MSLLDIWQANPELAEKRVDQIIAVAGSGKLRDRSDASLELREFLAAIDSTSLCRYADDCLTTRFEDSGLALQDIVNEIGRRLGFEVKHGYIVERQAASIMMDSGVKTASISSPRSRLPMCTP